MQYIPFMMVAAGLFGSLAVLIAGLIMSFRMGGWRRMMQLTPEGNWSRSRRFVYGGAIGFIIFNCLFTILTWIPGALPWMEAAGTYRPITPSTGYVARPTEQEAPDFDPKLSLEWPGVPEETRRRIDAGSAHETTIYSARFVTQTEPLTSFQASVYQFSEDDLQGYEPHKRLAEHGTNSSDEELTRKRIEHGSNNYLGFDVTAKSGTAFVRRITVMVETKIYTVEVLSLKPERLNAADVTRFFESFAVKD